MTETDLKFGGGYTYQWDCAILLALNYFFKPVGYNPILFNLISSFLGQVDEIHLEGEDPTQGIDLEDINLIGSNRRILIQVKSRQAENQNWIPSQPQLLKALYRFYTSEFLTNEPEHTRFVFLTNNRFNPDLVRVGEAVRSGTVDESTEARALRESLHRYAQREKRAAVELDRFRDMLARTSLVPYLQVSAVKANIQAKLQALGRQDWEQAQKVLFDYFVRQSVQSGGGIVTRESVEKELGLPPGARRIGKGERGETLRDKKVGITLIRPKAQVATELQSEIEKGESLLQLPSPSSKQELREWSAKYWHIWRQTCERILDQSFSPSEPVEWLKAFKPRHADTTQSWEVRAKDFSRDIEAELEFLKDLLVRLDNY